MRSHNILLVIVILMVSTYYLRLLSYKLAERKYSKHFKSNTKELNPFIAKAIITSDLLNKRYIIGTCLMVLFLYYYITYAQENQFYEVFMGFVVMNQFMLFTTQAVNILLYKFVEINSEQLSGEIFIKEKYLYFKSACINLTYLALCSFLLIFVNSEIILGGVLCFALNLFSHIIWYRKTIKQK